MHTATRFSLERIAALDRALRAGEYPNARSLADRLEVSRRTVQRDIEFFRDRLGAPIAYDEVPPERISKATSMTKPNRWHWT